MAPRIADDQQTRLSMGTPMKSSAGSALQSLMSKGAKSNSPSPSGSPKMQGGETGNRPKVATDQKTVVSSATQLKATSKAGALLSSLVTSPKVKAAPKEAESARPTHSDRALEEAEAKVPLLGSGDGAVGLVASTQASPTQWPASQSVEAPHSDCSRALSVAGAICLLLLVVVVAGIVFLVKPQAHPHHTQGSLRKEGHEAASTSQRPVVSTRSEAPRETKPTAKEAVIKDQDQVRDSRSSTTTSSLWGEKENERAELQRNEHIESQNSQAAEAFDKAVAPLIADIGEAKHALSEGYDCEDEKGLRANEWSSEHIEYCCVNNDVGCDALPSANCDSPEAITDWTGWTESCNECGGGRKYRYRRWRPAFRHCDAANLPRYVHFRDEEPCHEVDVNKFVLEWSHWGQCSVSCGYGYRERVREMTKLAFQCHLDGAFPLKGTVPCERPPRMHSQ